MKERLIKTLRPGILDHWAAYDVVARMPSREDVQGLKVGDLAPDCFGRMSPVVEIFARGKDIKGQWYVCYYVEFGDQSKGRSAMSNSMREDELCRSVPLTGLLNSAQCDDLENELLAHAFVERGNKAQLS